MEKLKDMTFFFVPFLTFCGALYHITYWDSFGLNGLEFITLGEIVKSAIYPILSTAIFVLLGMLIGFFSPISSFFPLGEGKNTPTGKVINSKYVKALLWFLWAGALYSIKEYGTSPDRWIYFSCLAAIPISFKLESLFSLHNYVKDIRYQMVLYQTISYLSIFAYTTGKKKSEEVLLNMKYKYTTCEYLNDISTSSDTLKLLGTTDKFFIFSDLNNSKITFIESDNITLLDKK